MRGQCQEMHPVQENSTLSLPEGLPTLERPRGLRTFIIYEGRYLRELFPDLRIYLLAFVFP